MSRGCEAETRSDWSHFYENDPHESPKSLTSQGCLGGPVGCKDHALLEVTRGTERATVVLYVAHTQSQREQRVNQAHALGYTITLADLRGKRVTLDIRRPG